MSKADRTPIEPKVKRFKLTSVDLSKSMKKSAYRDKLSALQIDLLRIQQAYLATGDRAVIVLEGMDAAGKGGTIRRMTQVMDPRSCKVWPISAPRPEIQGKHYLARFWEKLPEPGRIAIFDRSWYGRVLVERVEGFASEAAWTRAYEEINEFERMLIDDGAKLVKLFLHVDREHQIERFAERFHEPIKRWKLSPEDVRNFQKRDDYVVAIEDMIERTSTTLAPWHVVPSNSKRYARVTAIRHVVKTLSKGVDLEPPPLDPELWRAARETFGFQQADP